MKLKFQCPQTLGCHSKSNCYASFSVFTLNCSHTSLWRENRKVLDWHGFRDCTGEPCLRAPLPGLPWLCSWPWSEDSVEPGAAPTRRRHALGILLWASWTLETTPRVQVGLLLPFMLATMCTSSHEGQLFVMLWMEREGERAMGLGPLCMSCHVWMQNSEQSGKSFGH